MDNDMAYPVRLEGRLDPGVSRWLWLVKWVLVIPHVVVLAFLWAGVFVVSLVAVVAVAFTGRYPRPIFDFNLGVLRWSWRVGFYAYSALGTDRYPPFTLDDVPNYPARLEITFPGRLPRGLWLLKWWVVALPHYVIVAVFAGGGAWLIGHSGEWSAPFQGGLITLLALVAGVVLLFTGRYPRGLFDLLLGLDRWVVRVGAYTALMADAYPPFRLDVGSADGHISMTPPVARTYPRSTTAPLKIALGSLMAVLALALAAAGTLVLVVSATQRDAQGFLMTPSQRFSTTTYALSSQHITTHFDGPDSLYADSALGRVRIRSDGSEKPLFIGIARSVAAESYLQGVRHEQVSRLGGNEHYVAFAGHAPAMAPERSDIWVASVSGSGTQQLTWKVRDGSWSVVVMNRDASAHVEARLSAGARLSQLGWVGAGLIVGGVVAGGIATALLVAALRRPHTQGGAARLPSPTAWR